MTSSLDKFVTSDNKTTWTIIGIFGVVWFFALSSSDLIWGPDYGGVIIYDVPNITTLILEVGFGIIIGLIIFFLTKRSDIQNKKTLAKIESLISKNPAWINPCNFSLGRYSEAVIHFSSGSSIAAHEHIKNKIKKYLIIC